VQLLINLLQSLLPNQAEAVHDEEAPNKKQSKIKSKNQQSKKRTSKEDGRNKFSSMPEFTMHKEDTSIDRKLSKHPPVSRMREFDPIKVTCRICGKAEIVSPGLVLEGSARYKCNNCSTQAG
jgi:predicted RNA-binding Zn-ribbon protein involved in translation (DUF1610 family)